MHPTPPLADDVVLEVANPSGDGVVEQETREADVVGAGGGRGEEGGAGEEEGEGGKGSKGRGGERGRRVRSGGGGGSRTSKRRSNKGASQRHDTEYYTENETDGPGRKKTYDVYRVLLSSGGSLLGGFLAAFILLAFLLPSYMEYRRRMHDQPREGTFAMSSHTVTVGTADSAAEAAGAVRRKAAYRGVTEAGEAMRAALDARRAAQAQAEEERRVEARRQLEREAKAESFRGATEAKGGGVGGATDTPSGADARAEEERRVEARRQLEREAKAELFRGATEAKKGDGAATDTLSGADARAEEERRVEERRQLEREANAQAEVNAEEEAKRSPEAKSAAKAKARLAAKAAGAAGETCGPVFDPQNVFPEQQREERIVWEPQTDKYLLAYCSEGDVSARLICFRNTVALAAALNRTVIVPTKPSEQFGSAHDLRVVLHLPTVHECFGPRAILSSQQYEESHKKPLQVDRLLCWHGPHRACQVTPNRADPGCPAAIEASKALDPKTGPDTAKFGVPTEDLSILPSSLLATAFGGGAQAGKALPPARGACLGGGGASVARARAAFGGVTDSVLAVGDLGSHPLVMHKLLYPTLQDMIRGLGEGQCRAHSVGGAVGPHPGLFSRSHAVRQALFQSNDYMALHWPWSDKGFVCTDRSTGCYYSPAQAAKCAARLANELNMADIFLNTDAPENEVSTFLAAAQAAPGGPRKFVRLPAEWVEGMSLPVWFNRLFPSGNFTSQLPMGELTLGKLLAARSTVFVGARFSAFTDDVNHMRFALRTSSCRDTYLCLADDERTPIP